MNSPTSPWHAFDENRGSEGESRRRVASPTLGARATQGVGSLGKTLAQALAASSCGGLVTRLQVRLAARFWPDRFDAM